MKTFDLIRLPLAAPAVLSGQKSFRKNPVIGSTALNARGLHRRRVAFAAAASARRRRRIASRLDPAEREAFDRDGFVMRHAALPADLIARVRDEVARIPRRAWQMRQGETVNRVTPLPARADGSALSELARFALRCDVRDLVGYAAGRTGHIITVLQTVAVEPAAGEADPQAGLHADTFHPSAKFWLFLNDVGADEGPFAYVPGSHRLTPQRLEWEHAQAQDALSSANPHHAAGSFRVSESELASLGYGPLETFAVPANTLLVADTYGFHRRTPSKKPTVRTSLYGVLRRNPFMPWNGLDPYDLPGLRGRAMRIHLAMQDRRAARGRPVVYAGAGTVLAERDLF